MPRLLSVVHNISKALGNAFLGVYNYKSHKKEETNMSVSVCLSDQIIV